MLEDYSIEEHSHRFGVWTAARAASASRLSNQEVQELFHQINLRAEVDALKLKNITDEIYCTWIKETGEKLISNVTGLNSIDFKKNKFCFGLAAKLISIYVKTVEVIPTKGASYLSAIAYPPLDSILLKNIKAHYENDFDTNWSTFDWQKYINWIEFLKTIKQDEPWWKLEAYWCI